MEYVNIGRVRPIYKGEHNPEMTYETLDVVRSKDGFTSYMAKKSVPAGTALMDEEYWGLMNEVKSDVVQYGSVQTLTGEQQDQARVNIGAASGKEVIELKDDLADAWVRGKTYAVGDYCISGNRLYKCKTVHTAGSAFSADYWHAVNIAGEVKNKLSSTQFVQSPFDAGTTYLIEFAENYSNSAIIFGCYGGGKGMLITYGNGYIWNANPTDEVEVTGPTGADNYRSIRIKNATTGGYGYIGVISIRQSVGITAI